MLGVILLIAFAVIFYKAAEMENLNMPIIWGAASVVLSIFGGGGLLGIFAWQFIFQGHHKTTSGYVDPLDFNIKNGSNSESCILRLFSISGIHGALGDAGQNFKSLAFLLNEVFPGSSETIYYGCGGN